MDRQPTQLLRQGGTVLVGMVVVASVMAGPTGAMVTGDDAVSSLGIQQNGGPGGSGGPGGTGDPGGGNPGGGSGSAAGDSSGGSGGSTGGGAAGTGSSAGSGGSASGRSAGSGSSAGSGASGGGSGSASTGNTGGTSGSAGAGASQGASGATGSSAGAGGQTSSGGPAAGSGQAGNTTGGPTNATGRPANETGRPAGGQALAVEPARVTFGSVGVNESATETVTLSNTGSATQQIADIVARGKDSGAYRVDNASFSLAPNESRAITVTWDPTTPGPASARLLIEGVNTSRPLATVELAGSGTGSAPPATNGSAGSLALPSTLDFEGVPVGENATATLPVTNDGNRTVTVDNVAVQGGAASAFTVDASSFTVRANETRQLNVTFGPDTAGQHIARVMVETNNTTPPRVTAGLRGVGTAPAVTARPKSLQFGAVELNETVTRELRVSNRGSAPLNVTESAFSGTGRDVYTVRDEVPVIVPAGETRSLTVAFTPDRARTFSGTLTLTTNDPTKPSVPIWVSNSNTTVDIDVQGTNETQRLNATVENVEKNESVTINSSSGSPDQSVAVETVSVTPETDGNFTLNMSSQPDPDETTPEFNTSDGTEPLEYINVSHSIPNSEIAQASMTVRLSKERIEAMETTDPEDVSLYRYENGSWTEKPTRIDRETATHVVYNVSADGFSEWTAGAKQASFEVIQADVAVSTLTTGETTGINVRISNTGGADGEFQTELLLDGDVVETKSIEISAGGASQVTFRRSFTESGTYRLQVNDYPVGSVSVQPNMTTTATQTAATTTSGSGPTGLPFALAVLGIALVVGGRLRTRQ